MSQIKTGFFTKKPRQGAPSFVEASLSVKVDEAIEFLRQNKNSAGYVNFDINRSHDGDLYVQHNNYKPANTDAP